MLSSYRNPSVQSPTPSELRQARQIALDHALGGALPRMRLAMDRDSVRSYTPDGHLRISDANLSKAEVNVYTGAELIPNIADGARLGLDPNARYPVLRPAEELHKAAPSFNALPVLWGHQPLDAANHPADLVVGATGDRSRFEFPFLRNSLVIWLQIAIDAIEDGIDNLSAAYRYTAEPEQGTFRGARYWFRMTNIIGNHIACVDRGRVPGAVIGDSLPTEFRR